MLGAVGVVRVDEEIKLELGEIDGVWLVVARCRLEWVRVQDGKYRVNLGANDQREKVGWGLVDWCKLGYPKKIKVKKKCVFLNFLIDRWRILRMSWSIQRRRLRNAIKSWRRSRTL